MRLLVTGRDGQVAKSLALRSAADPNLQIVNVGRPEIDLARPDTLRGVVAAVRPDLVVSAAAYTAVDQAEDEPDLAMLINATAPGVLAQEAAAANIPIIHLSTDYVFSGDSDRPYEEDDATGPRSVYGSTKLAGEHAVAEANPRHIILRTAWVYSAFGKNFVKTMLRLATDRDVVPVVADQWGNPTSALDIADGIHVVAAQLLDRGAGGPCGVYHLAGTGSTHWAGFAAHVFEVSRQAGGPFATVREITTADYPTKARRPANSRLATDRLHQAFGWRAPEWQASCARVVGLLLSGGAAAR